MKTKRKNMREPAASPTNPYFHEEVTYDSKKENWSGLFSLLLIPLFILLVGVGVLSTFNLPKSNGTGGFEGGDDVQIGIGGGGNISPSPTPRPSVSISPTERLSPDVSGEGLYLVQ